MRKHPRRASLKRQAPPLIGKTRRFAIPPNRRHQDRRRREDRRAPSWGLRGFAQEDIS